jgi:hypothetical protein
VNSICKIGFQLQGLYMLDYFTHKFNPNQITLVMTILVKNEADIIEANIKTHNSLGVDAFVIMDNDSTDGTREILSNLKDEFEITIIDESGYYQQKKFMTKLAFLAKKIYKPNWIINNDADEFWIPNKSGSLKEYLNFKGGILRVDRFNMIPPLESVERENIFFDSIYEVSNQINYRVAKREDISVLLGQASRKVITNPYGLIKINSGNHSAEHIAFWNKKYSKDIKNYHYPIRSYKQFEKRVITRKEVLENFPNVKMGNHYRVLVSKYNRGELKEEYRKFIFKQNEIELLKKIGVVSENRIPFKTIIR